MNNYLAHHGILGQKWGIRKYQNKDGTLTAEGRAHYGDVRQKVLEKTEGKERRIGKLSDDWYERERKDEGIESIDKDTDLIKKGATFQRIATYGEPVDSKRKYVSILYDDKLEYVTESDVLPVGDKDKVAIINYESKKPIKVATLSKTQEEIRKFMGDDTANKYYQDLYEVYGQKKTNGLLKEFGNKKVSELTYDPTTLQELLDNENKTFSKKELKKNEYLKYYLDAQKLIVDNASDRIAVGKDAEKSEAFYKHMKKLGYDAFVDPLDATQGHVDYPLVLLSPDKTIKKTKEKYAYD